MGTLSFTERTECPACGARRADTVYVCPFERAPVRDYIAAHMDRRGQVSWERLEGAEYRVDRCASCGLYFQRWVPTDELVSEVYDRWVAPDEVDDSFDDDRLNDFLQSEWGGSFDIEHTHPTQSPAAHEMHLIAARLGKEVSQLRVLDYGIGWSRWARAVRNMGAEVVGYEMSQKCVAYAERLGFSMLAYDEIAEERFDFINTEQVFEHVVNPYEVLGHLRRAVTPGGILKFSVPRAFRVPQRLDAVDVALAREDREAYFPIEPVIHLQAFSRRSVGALARRVGLRLMPVWSGIGWSFVRRRGVRWQSPVHVAKSLLRPVHRTITPRNLYVLLRG